MRLLLVITQVIIHAGKATQPSNHHQPSYCKGHWHCTLHQKSPEVHKNGFKQCVALLTYHKFPLSPLHDTLCVHYALATLPNRLPLQQTCPAVGRHKQGAASMAYNMVCTPSVLVHEINLDPAAALLLVDGAADTNACYSTTSAETICHL